MLGFRWTAKVPHQIAKEAPPNLKQSQSLDHLLFMPSGIKLERT